MCTSLSGVNNTTFEIIFVDDGSSDATWATQCQLAAKAHFVKCIRLSRNFGHQIAVCAGLDRAQGDFIAIIDADLQDPPEVIPEMLAKAESGFDIALDRNTMLRLERPPKGSWLS